jgi:GNAT superfamily N-acetyltransferase
MIVRQYQARDWEAILLLVLQLVEESPVYREAPVDVDKVRRLSELALRHEDWLVAVAGEGEALVGFVMLWVEEHLFSRRKLCGDVALYVDPAWRGSSAAARLLRFGEGWAIARGAPEIRMGITTGINPELVGRFYRKCGYQPAGTLYSKQLSAVVLPRVG